MLALAQHTHTADSYERPSKLGNKSSSRSSETFSRASIGWKEVFDYKCIEEEEASKNILTLYAYFTACPTWS